MGLQGPTDVILCELGVGVRLNQHESAVEVPSLECLAGALLLGIVLLGIAAALQSTFFYALQAAAITFRRTAWAHDPTIRYDA